MPETSEAPLLIESYKGQYKVKFCSNLQDVFLDFQELKKSFFIIDEQVLSLYKSQISPHIGERVLTIEANEGSKSLEKCPEFIQALLAKGLRRGDTLVAIGGGITQDITCFIASCLFRGLEWVLVPTTLLAQADSCIGSKSSINLGGWKNIVGTFTPPRNIWICPEFLKTLENKDILSGLGEMIKVHIIDGPSSFDKLYEGYQRVLAEDSFMLQFIRESLLIKKRLIEIDEFDKGPRNVMNYGHSFGHAIEAATGFSIPHGVAVTIGMDMANYYSWRAGKISKEDYYKYNPILMKNAGEFIKLDIPIDPFITAISKDKKNVGADLKLILLNHELKTEICRVPNDEEFRRVCVEYFSRVKQ